VERQLEKVQVPGLSLKSVPSTSRISIPTVLSSPVANEKQPQIHPAQSLAQGSYPGKAGINASRAEPLRWNTGRCCGTLGWRPGWCRGTREPRRSRPSSILGGRSLSSDISIRPCPPVAHCRAGFQPRRKPTRLRPPTACAGVPAQSPPYVVDLRAFRRGPLATAFPWPPAVWRPALGVRQQCGGLIYGTGIRNHSKALKT